MDIRQGTVVALLASAGCVMNGPAASRPEWRRMVRTPQDVGVAADTISFLSRDSLRLRAWWIPAMPTGGPARATVVLAHGSGTN